MTITKTLTFSERIHNVVRFRGTLNAKQFLCGAMILQSLSMCMDLYLLRYENDFATYALALNNPGFMIFYLYLFGCIIAARLRDLQINPSLSYFWVCALWFLTFGIRMCIPLPLGATYPAVCLLLIPLMAKSKKTLGLK